MGKGGDFEREVAKFLTCWLTGQEKPYVYWRMPGSGSLSTIHEENENLTGDIAALTPEAEFLVEVFSIECKTGYEKTSFWQHFKGIKNFNIEIFWQQCFNDATRAGKQPMLIYRKKRQRPIVGVTRHIAQKLGILNKMRNISLDFCYKLPPLHFFPFDEFWDNVTPDMVESLLDG